MLTFYGTRLSDNMAETPEGYLICYDVNIARIGTQEYLGSELGISDEVVTVNRPAEEVFKPATVASFEGKPFTNDHPYELLDANNTSIYSKGHLQNVRVSDDKTYLVGDIIVTDSQAVQDIKNGKREISAGYDCDCLQDDNGNWYQANIIGNHVALVDKGRAGDKVRINDAEWNESDHPRAENGQFEKGGGGSAPKQEKSESEEKLKEIGGEKSEGGEKSGVSRSELKNALKSIVSKYKVKSEKELMQIFGNENNLKLAISEVLTKEKPMKDNKSVLGKLFKAFAKDAEPDEIVEALKEVKGEDEEPDRIGKLEAMVQDLCARMDAYDEAHKPAEEPETTALDEAEKELLDAEPEEEKKEVEDEDANNDPKLIEAVAEKAQNDEDTTEEIKKEIADAKKVIAKIEDKETRLAVADSFAKVIRGKMTSSANYKKLMDASKRKPIADSKKPDYNEVFKKIKEDRFRK